MAKSSGGTRVILPSNSHEVLDPNWKFDESLSYFNSESGGSVLIHQGRTPDADEYDVAKAMANDGHSIRITPEGKIEFSTGKTNKGDHVYADGVVSGYTYEQATKKPERQDPEALAKAVDRALKHAYDKRAQVPLIYDKFGMFHRHDIEAGLARFESRNSYRFKAILVADQHLKIWEHVHNK